MLAIPTPLPDELSRSYQGRLMRMNAVSSDREIIERLAAELGVEESDRRRVTATDILSKAACMEIESFVRLHTLVPLKRGINSYLPELPHGGLGSEGVLFLSGPRLVREHSYLCTDCIRADLDRYGISYWHREHQVPGVLRCARHRSPLRYVEGDAALLRAPSQCEPDSNKIHDEALACVEGHEGIRRFLAIMDGLLDSHRPYPVPLVSARLKALAKSRGLLTYPSVRSRADSKLLSDLVKDSFPAAWLSTVFPELVAKPRGLPLSQMDGVLYLANSSAATAVYGLACAVLYESADAALADLAAALKGPRPIRATSGRKPIADATYREAYLRHGGVYSATARQLAVSVQAAGSRLQRMGLPDMKEAGQSRMRRALFSFFVMNLDLNASATASGLPIASVEAAVRQAGYGIAQVLRELDRASESGRRKQVRQSKSGVAWL